MHAAWRAVITRCSSKLLLSPCTSLLSATTRRAMTHTVAGVDTDRLYREVTAMVGEYLTRQERRDSKVIDFKSPTQLRDLVDLTLPEEATSDEVVLQTCRDALQYCVHTCKLATPLFLTV